MSTAADSAEDGAAPRRGRLPAVLGAAILAAVLLGPGAAVAADPPDAVRFNETEIASTLARRVDASRPMEVLRYVLAAAGDEITVYPSEGYFYFQFQNRPERIAGNIRFDVVDAAQGKLNFGYYAPSTYGTETVNHFSVLTAADGVRLVTVSPFEYRLSFENQTVRVHIYDARAELAGPKPLGPGEVYVGPVFDESGVRMHLLFDETENAFLFVLNGDTPPADTWAPLSIFPRVEIGDRTGYAFYRDEARGRRILVGISYANLRANNYFDGPFDQLPDRFVSGERLQELIERSSPDLKGQIGPRGLFLDREFMRAMVAPYRRYDDAEEFGLLSQCDAYAADNHALTRCLQSFAYGEASQN